MKSAAVVIVVMSMAVILHLTNMQVTSRKHVVPTESSRKTTYTTKSVVSSKTTGPNVAPVTTTVKPTVMMNATMRLITVAKTTTKSTVTLSQPTTKKYIITDLTTTKQTTTLPTSTKPTTIIPTTRNLTVPITTTVAKTTTGSSVTTLSTTIRTLLTTNLVATTKPTTAKPTAMFLTTAKTTMPSTTVARTRTESTVTGPSMTTKTLLTTNSVTTPSPTTSTKMIPTTTKLTMPITTSVTKTTSEPTVTTPSTTTKTSSVTDLVATIKLTTIIRTTTQLTSIIPTTTKPMATIPTTTTANMLTPTIQATTKRTTEMAASTDATILFQDEMSLTNNVDYCAICPDHTLCLYDTGYGSTCEQMYISRVTAAEKQSIVHLYNQVRNKVALGQETRGAPGPQPSAANMRKMFWDDELATIAQRWANQCIHGFDTCRLVPRFKVSQSVAWGVSTANNTASNWMLAIQTSWYGEVALFDSANISSYSYDARTSHYTQVAWALTNMVGCGYAYYTSTENSQYNKMYVCNYGPQNDWRNHPLYVAGTACSQCPSGTTCDTTYPGLCALTAAEVPSTTTIAAHTTTTPATTTSTAESMTTAATTATTSATTTKAPTITNEETTHTTTSPATKTTTAVTTTTSAGTTTGAPMRTTTKATTTVTPTTTAVTTTTSAGTTTGAPTRTTTKATTTTVTPTTTKTTPSTTSVGSTGGTGTTASTASYCAICSDHTMCKYPTDGPGSACQPSLVRNINSADKQEIVDLHNNLRNKLARGLEYRGSPGPQPPAANMRKFAWDNELAVVAQRWADQCMYRHDTCRDIARFELGQNIAFQGSTSNTLVRANWTWPITAWYDEVEMYSNANVNPFSFNLSTGHYTQIAWADTNLIGCGYSSYKKSSSDIWYIRYYVCDYGISGNWQGEGLYIAGSPCSECPSDTTCDSTYTGLCV